MMEESEVQGLKQQLAKSKQRCIPLFAINQTTLSNFVEVSASRSSLRVPIFPALFSTGMALIMGVSISWQARRWIDKGRLVWPPCAIHDITRILRIPPRLALDLIHRLFRDNRAPPFDK